MSIDCTCYRPPFDYRDFTSASIGIDETKGRFGDVSIETCLKCGTKWLRYFVEYEAFTASGRWFRAPIMDAEVATITPESAVALLEQKEWHFVGGSYFRTQGERRSGAIRADL